MTSYDESPPCSASRRRVARRQGFRAVLLCTLLVALGASCTASVSRELIRSQSAATAGATRATAGGERWLRVELASASTRGPEAVRGPSAVRKAPPERPRVGTPRRTERATGSGTGGAACYQALTQANVGFTKLPSQRADGVDHPIRLNGEVAGIAITGGRKNAPTNYLDCRLAGALLAWAPSLKEAGVVGISHYSMYRENAKVAGTRKVSSHAGGMAIDAAKFHFADGTTFSVLEDWTDKSRGAEPCTPRAQDSEKGAIVRRLVCEASRANVFQTVITPHYNAAHHNHLHLEVATGPKHPWMR